MLLLKWAKKNENGDIVEKIGFDDKDIATAEHDEMILKWSDKERLHTLFLKELDMYEDKLGIEVFDATETALGVPLGMFHINKDYYLDPNESQKRYDMDIEIEYPILNRKKHSLVGYTDLFVIHKLLVPRFTDLLDAEVLEILDAEDLKEYEQEEMDHASKVVRTKNKKIIYGHNYIATKSVLIELKPNIANYGAFLRRIKTYSTYLNPEVTLVITKQKVSSEWVKLFQDQGIILCSDNANTSIE